MEVTCEVVIHIVIFTVGQNGAVGCNLGIQGLLDETGVVSFISNLRKVTKTTILHQIL